MPTFLRARVRRIYPPYYFASALTVDATLAAGVLVSRGVLGSSHLADVRVFHRGALYYLSALTLTQIPLRQELLLTVFWSLCYEVAFYLVVAVALASTLRDHRATRWLHSLNLLLPLPGSGSAVRRLLLRIGRNNTIGGASPSVS